MATKKFTETRSFLKTLLVVVIAITLAVPAAYLLLSNTSLRAAQYQLITSAQPDYNPPPDSDDEIIIFYSGDNSGPSGGSSSSDNPPVDPPDPDNGEYNCDLNNDSIVGEIDLNILLAFWGPYYGCEIYNLDPVDDSIVNVKDFLFILAAWGPCEEERDNYLGDLNCDSTVDERDYNLILAFWGEENPNIVNNPDINGDGYVDVNDFLILLANWTGVASPDEIQDMVQAGLPDENIDVLSLIE